MREVELEAAMEIQQTIEIAEQVLHQEAMAIEDAAKALSRDPLRQQFMNSCRLLLDCRGKIAITGVGKSGHIARKLAATFASTGTPAFFIHPSDAGHGDLGLIGDQDLVFIISHSGESSEINTLLPYFRDMGTKLLILTGNPRSSIAKVADVVLAVHEDEKACPLGAAPMTSTTVSLALGDALAAVLMSSKDISLEDFARSHPGGTLGKMLTLTVGNLMVAGDNIPCVSHNCLLLDALCEISQKGLGMTLIVDENRRVSGIFTDGDLRRTIDDYGYDLREAYIRDTMTRDFHYFTPETMAQKVLDHMQNKRIQSAPVLDYDNKLIGAIHIHNLLAAGLKR